MEKNFKNKCIKILITSLLYELPFTCVNASAVNINTSEKSHTPQTENPQTIPINTTTLAERIDIMTINIKTNNLKLKNIIENLNNGNANILGTEPKPPKNET